MTHDHKIQYISLIFHGMVFCGLTYRQCYANWIENKLNNTFVLGILHHISCEIRFVKTELSIFFWRQQSDALVTCLSHFCTVLYILLNLFSSWICMKYLPLNIKITNKQSSNQAVLCLTESNAKNSRNKDILAANKTSFHV